MPGWYLPHVQDDVNPHILRMFSLDADIYNRLEGQTYATLSSANPYANNEGQTKPICFHCCYRQAHHNH